MSEPENPNSFEVALPVRVLPDGTVRVGHDLPPGPEGRFPFPVVPNEGAEPKASKNLSNSQ